MNLKRFSLSCLSIGPGLGLMIVLITLAAVAAQIDLVGPPGSGAFGAQVTVLPNGNLVVSDPSYDLGGLADVGAVYLYDGASGALISTLTGSTAGDQVGSGGVTVLANGNYLVLSSVWNNSAGAVTWGGGTSGVSGEVSALNSLVGSAAGDQAGSGGVTELTNGNYVVISSNWDNGAGAVTWGSGASGVSGVIGALNSLVGSSAGDLVGNEGVTVLANGNYVVRSLNWDAGAGAVTWSSGVSGVSGEVSALNSLVGSSTGDQVGDYYVTALANGNYVVSSPNWDNGAVVDAGAVTWGSGASGVSGVVSALNSLVGSTAGDQVGCGIFNSDYCFGGVTELANGNYVVISPHWDNGAVADAGAVTWGSGTSGVSGVVSALNSLVGSSPDDHVGSGNFYDHYYVNPYYCSFGVTKLANGNYVVVSPTWDNGAVVDAGAVTWGSGTSGVSGVVSALNSLVGKSAGDIVGCGILYHDGRGGPVGTAGVRVLANGNYLVGIPYWDKGAAADAGAVTWGSGTSGVSGVVSAANSLVGKSAGDQVGCSVLYDDDDCLDDVIELTNGNYVVRSPSWDKGAAADAGAVTWGSGTSGVSGVVSALNSLVGSSAGDQVSSDGLMALANGNYVVYSPSWDNGAAADSGAVTLGDGIAGTTYGPVAAGNSVVGTAADGGSNIDFTFDEFNEQLVVGRPADNIVSLYRPDLTPLANAGADQTAHRTMRVRLDGSGSRNPYIDQALTFGWTQDGGPPVALSSVTAASPTFIAPAVVTQTIPLTFTLVVTNTLGLASAPDQVVVRVEPNFLVLPLVSRQAAP